MVKTTRLLITPNDIQVLTGLGIHAACKEYNYCLDVLGKPRTTKRINGPDGKFIYKRGHKLTIAEYCQVNGLNETEARKCLAL